MGLAAEYDVLVDASDNVATRYLANDVSSRQRRGLCLCVECVVWCNVRRTGLMRALTQTHTRTRSPRVGVCPTENRMMT